MADRDVSVALRRRHLTALIGSFSIKARIQFFQDILTHLGHVQFERLKNAGRNALVLAQQAEQQMLGADIAKVCNSLDCG